MDVCNCNHMPFIDKPEQCAQKYANVSQTSCKYSLQHARAMQIILDSKLHKLTFSTNTLALAAKQDVDC